MTNDDAIAPIGAGGTLLHIGPHKTGTTAIQGALALARPKLAEQGVLYPGTSRSQADAARAASGFASTTGVKLPPKRVWTNIVEQVAGHAGRTVISSEYFDVVMPDRGREIVEEIGGSSVDVVITASPLASVMPSSWQQAVRAKLRLPFEDWLRTTFERESTIKSQRFWLRQRVDEQVRRWAEVVGLDRVHVVVTDKTRPRQLFDGFEDLLGLPRDLLQPKRSAANRSFTLQEIELIRQLNERIKSRNWPVAVQARFIRLGAVRQLQGRKPRPDEQRVAMPAWANDRANEVAREMIANIEASGVHVVGDLQALVTDVSGDADAPTTVTSVDIDVAIRAVIGAMRGGGAELLREDSVTAASLRQYPGISSAPTELLRAELERREAAGATRRRFRR